MLHLPSLIECLDFTPRCMAEIGVSFPEHSLLGAYSDKCPVLLVEPHLPAARALAVAFPNARVRAVAVAEHSGQAQLFDQGQGSWLTSVKGAPGETDGGATVQDSHVSPVRAVRMDEIDPGNIDVLTLDMEGSEWWALKHLVSRPLILSIETHLTNGYYINPYRAEIEEWCFREGYCKIAEDITDSFYLRKYAGRPGGKVFEVNTPAPEHQPG